MGEFALPASWLPRQGHHGFAQHGVENIEYGTLVFGIFSGGVSVVAKHEPQICGMVSSPFVVGIAHLAFRSLARSWITQHPDARRFWSADHRMGNKVRVRIA